MSLKRWQTAAEIKSHRKAQAKYEASPIEVKKRENRNRSRYDLEQDGKVSKGDNKDVIHKDGNALNSSIKDVKAGSRHKNRSYPRDSKAHKLHPND